MLNVFFTVDVEIWCGGWANLDEKFPKAFQRYIYGDTTRGEYGLRYQVKKLQEYGLKGVFFVEPLFATRFGIDALREVVGIIKEHGQEVQLHMHPEWVDESHYPILEKTHGKRPLMRDFSLSEQTKLIAVGCDLLEQASGGKVNAFRAGNFGFNTDTLRALAVNNIHFDSSYNASMFGLSSGVTPGESVFEPIECEGVNEYPMTVFNDGTSKLRHAQLGACSTREMEGLLWQALKSERKAFVMLSHNFELLNVEMNRRDDVVVKRFDNFCRFMDKNRDSFRVCGFHDLTPVTVQTQPDPLSSPFWKTGHRMVEQVMRRRFR